MKRFSLLAVVTVVAAGFGSTSALATDLNVWVRSGGSSDIMVDPGAVVNYEVVGELTNNLNEGLALVGFDLEFSGGPLTQAVAPTTPPMDNFVNDAVFHKGIDNPAGYGGTVQSGRLVQVGGGQNTIRNISSNAPFPLGMVMTRVAWPGSPVVLVTGSLTAPSEPDTYTLTLTNLFANVIKQGETGDVFYAAEQAGVGTIVNLSIQVGGDVLPDNVVSTSPPNNAIDARQTSNVDGTNPAGWQSIDITFDSAAGSVAAANFAVTVNPPDVAAPTVMSVTHPSANTVTVTLSGIIPSGHWTNITYTPSNMTVRLGFLPADVNADKTASALDILALIDCINNVSRPTNCDWDTDTVLYSSDADRSGQRNSQDILREIDLLNGAGEFEAWNGRTLPN